MQNERRSSSRKPEFCCAVVQSDDGGPGLAVMVRDLSLTGAKLAIPPDLRLSEEFDLDLISRGVIVRALVRWRRFGEVGVSFKNQWQRKAERSDDVLARIAALEAKLTSFGKPQLLH